MYRFSWCDSSDHIALTFFSFSVPNSRFIIPNIVRKIVANIPEFPLRMQGAPISGLARANHAVNEYSSFLTATSNFHLRYTIKNPQGSFSFTRPSIPLLRGSYSATRVTRYVIWSKCRSVDRFILKLIDFNQFFPPFVKSSSVFPKPTTHAK